MITRPFLLSTLTIILTTTFFFSNSYGASLHDAVEIGDKSLAKELIANGADVNARVYLQGGFSPLHKAIEKDDEDMVKLLIASGADVNLGGRWNSRTPLQAALKSGKTAIIDLLIDNGATPSFVGPLKRTESRIPDFISFENEGISVDMPRKCINLQTNDTISIKVKAYPGNKNKITFVKVTWILDQKKKSYKLFGKKGADNPFGLIKSFRKKHLFPIHEQTQEKISITVPSNLSFYEKATGKLIFYIEGWRADTIALQSRFWTSSFKNNIEVPWYVFPGSCLSFFPRKGNFLIVDSVGMFFLSKDGVVSGPYEKVVSPLRWFLPRKRFSNLGWHFEDEPVKTEINSYGIRIPFGAHKPDVGWMLQKANEWFIITPSGIDGPYEEVGQPGVFVSHVFCYSARRNGKWFVKVNETLYGPFQGIFSFTQTTGPFDFLKERTLVRFFSYVESKTLLYQSSIAEDNQ